MLERPQICAYSRVTDVNEVEGCPLHIGLLSLAPPVDLSHDYPFESLTSAIPMRFKASASGHPNA